MCRGGVISLKVHKKWVFFKEFFVNLLNDFFARATARVTSRI